LQALLEAVAPRQQDTVVTLGNYIDHGPGSRAVLGLLLTLVRRCTLVPLKGDHEEMFLAALESRGELRSWLKLGGDQTLRSYGVDHPRAVPKLHRSFLNSCEDHYETEAHWFVHAADQAGPNAAGKVVVIGHTPQKDGDILNLGHIVCIDTYCHGGGWLTALDVEAGHYWQANEQGQVREGRLRRPATDPIAP
jgi:serine/threonine protein phosphatase 1